MSKEEFIEKFKKISEKLSIPYKNIDIYYMACTHSSFANENGVLSNERLEFLGDSILGFYIAELLYKKFPDMPEGEMTKNRFNYVCAHANSKYAVEIGLNECLMLGKGEMDQGGLNKQNLLADLFEAFLGAVFLDLGIEFAKETLNKIILPKIGKKSFFEDYKSKLQEYVQSSSRVAVKYVLVSETGPSHNKKFTISVFHNNIKLGTGEGVSKKEAEQMAAKDALDKLAK
ncbi:MAG: ribonuclease III [Bacilli bacterium]|nr:ribonuclease III [Bacilli bacterium]